MSIGQIRNLLLKQIEDADERLLKMMYAMAEAYEESEQDPIIGYDADGNPQYASMLRKDLEEEVKGAKQGKYISLKELENRSEKWLKRTK